MLPREVRVAFRAALLVNIFSPYRERMKAWGVVRRSIALAKNQERVRVCADCGQPKRWRQFKSHGRSHYRRAVCSACFKRRERAQKRGVVSTFNGVEWAKLVALFGGCCAYCGEFPDELHRDHVVPLSRRGPDVALNIVPACPRCNLAKGAGDAPIMAIDWRFSDFFETHEAFSAWLATLPIQDQPKVRHACADCSEPFWGTRDAKRCQGCKHRRKLLPKRSTRMAA